MTQRKYKATVCGHFAFGQQKMNGQTIKTQNICRALKETYGEEHIATIDTCGGVIALLRMPWQLMRAARQSENIVVLPGQRGLYVVAAVLALLRARGINITTHYVVIGGWLPDLLHRHAPLRNIVRKAFDNIYCETKGMRQLVEEASGMTAVWAMPNFKYLTTVTGETFHHHETGNLLVCTLSRLHPAKGIKEAAAAVMNVNKRLQRKAVTLHIYGGRDAEAEQWFDDFMQTTDDSVGYMGSIPSDKTTATLQNYDLLLFPTYYEGEGFAGTLIDAFTAGVPPVVSDWKYNTEIVEDRKTGFVVPTHDISAIEEILLSLLASEELLLATRLACMAKATEFQPEEVIKTLTAHMA